MLDMVEAEDRDEQVDETGGVEDEFGADESVVEQGGLDAVPEVAKSSRAGVTFTKMEKAMLQKAFCSKSPDGSIKSPDRFTEEMLQKALRKYPDLNPIYQKLKARPGETAAKTRNTIRKSIFPKSKK